MCSLIMIILSAGAVELVAENIADWKASNSKLAGDFLDRIFKESSSKAKANVDNSTFGKARHLHASHPPTMWRPLLPVSSRAIPTSAQPLYRPRLLPSPGQQRAGLTFSPAQPCAISEGVDSVPDLASSIRSAKVKTLYDVSVSLGNRIGNGTSIVVFVGHMGDPNMWSYTNQWARKAKKDAKYATSFSANGVSGPFFVTFGDSDKLCTFLDDNNFVEKFNIFVEDKQSCDAYKAAGLKKKTDVTAEDLKNVKQRSANLEPWQWLQFADDLDKINPIRVYAMLAGDKSDQLDFLGGTFVLNGNDVVYQWKNLAPGHLPDVEEVLAIAKKAAQK